MGVTFLAGSLWTKRHSPARNWHLNLASRVSWSSNPWHFKH